MGAAARKITRTAAPARPALKVVRGGSRRTRTRAAAIGTFRLVATCMVILMTAGVVRVSLAASAAEASIDAWELRSEVKAERQVGRTLEADRSALASPSRIEELACQTLNMTRPAEVCYLEMPAAAVAASPGEDALVDDVDTEPAPVREAAQRVVATLADLAASEAEVLLVGDMGLGTLR
ncbi:MAG TPA: hypothetical protein DCP20_03865 [Coriobacteriia bacterium]|nr:MAG: hypothetical protein XD74_0584 [Actinobacteria bacterium 66_15]HAL29838.1 hypothetical protein [Coriobacteriia bacterium]